MANVRFWPVCSPEEIRKALKDGRVRLGMAATQDAAREGLDAHDMKDCLEHLETQHFDVSKPGKTIEGWHTVYKIVYDEVPFYIKIVTTSQNDLVYVASFKRDQSSNDF